MLLQRRTSGSAFDKDLKAKCSIRRGFDPAKQLPVVLFSCKNFPGEVPARLCCIGLLAFSTLTLGPMQGQAFQDYLICAFGIDRGV